MANLFLIRGIPGSGKTSLASYLTAKGVVDFFTEADFYMVDRDNNYKFDPKKLPSCHDSCFSFAKEKLSEGYNVAVSNTFIRRWEMKRYIDYASDNDHTVTIIVCDGDFGNTHGVPEEKVQKMKENFEW